jgi:YD repeat-containing protein
LSLTALTETVAINGRNYTSVFNSSTRGFVNTSPAGRQAALTLDLLGRVTQTQVAGIQPINFVYDSRGRLASTMQGTGTEAHTSTFGYNSSGYLETVTDPLNRMAHYEYDEAGRVIQQTLPDGRAIRYSYDANGNLSSLTPPGRPEHSFRYTPVNLASEYDPPGVGAGSQQTPYSYNGERQPTLILRPDGQTVSFNYDAAVRLGDLALPQGQVSYSYNPSTGNLASITAIDGGSVSFSYDGPLPIATTWAGSVAGSVSRTYDNNFRTTSRSVME